MRPLRIVLPAGAAFEVHQRHVLQACAAVAAVCLMAVYVQLLQESVTRGEQFRAEQRASAGATTVKTVADLQGRRSAKL